MAKTLTGIVSSDKVDKTIVVTVYSGKTHPLYRKKFMVTTKFMAHDEKNEAKLGDKVVIVETRPLSARKRFALEKIVETAQIRHTEPEPEIAKSPKLATDSKGAPEAPAKDSKPTSSKPAKEQEA